MEEQLQRPPAIKKITVPDQKKLFQSCGGAPGAKGSAGAVVATSPVTVTTPKASQKPKHPLQPSPRACLCAPTTHAGSFRCRLHRGGFNEIGKKPGA